MLQNMNVLLFKITLVLYFLGTLHYLIFLVVQKKMVSKIATITVVCGFVFHSMAIIVRMIEAGYVPITDLFESLSFFGWTIILGYLIAEYKYKISALGAFVVTLAFIMLLYAAHLPKQIDPLDPALQSIWLGIHTTLAFLGDGAFALAFGVGIMYLIQERQLKSKKPGVFYYRLPSLEVLDQLNYRALTFGFPLLTLGIITGAIWAEYAWGSYWSWDPKETWSLITWFIYAALLHARLTVGWRGKKAAILAIIGFFAVLFTFLGVNLLTKYLYLESLHAY